MGLRPTSVFVKQRHVQKSFISASMVGILHHCGGI